MAVVEIEIPPRSPYVGVVRLAIGTLARSTQLEPEGIDDLKMAVSEACANAVLAHEESGSEDPVLIRWSDSEDRIEIHVDQAAATAPNASTADSQGFSTRLVLSTALLESLVDELAYSDRPEGGTRTRLVLAISST